jgi:myo-inositol 2-dehydrogenase/D-chiro-inositol 1-dehydrogenase
MLPGHSPLSHIMRIGVIGVGRIGQYHADTARRLPEVERVIVTDADDARAKRLAAKLDADVAHDVDDLVRRVDAVVIASPTETHADLLRRCLDAGKPTFCEKPIALDLASTKSAVEHVERSGIPVQIGFQRRFDPGYRAARDAVRSEALGKIYSVRISGHDPAPPHESYVPSSGGIFRDLHIHDFDIVRWVLGQEVTEVYAQGAVLVEPFFAKYDDVDTATVSLAFSNGTLGVLTGARHDPVGYDVRLEIFGSRDSVAVGWDARTPLHSLEPGMPASSARPYSSFLDRFDTAYRAELQAFIDLVCGRAENPCPAAEAEPALRTALACDVSRREHRPVRVAEIDS